MRAAEKRKPAVSTPAGFHQEVSNAGDERKYTPDDPVLPRQKRWRLANPEKYKAHIAVASAIRAGKITLPKICEDCGADGRLDRHHDRYDARHVLRVRVLCRRCHSRWHSARRKAGAR